MTGSLSPVVSILTNGDGISSPLSMKGQRQHSELPLRLFFQVTKLTSISGTAARKATVHIVGELFRPGDHLGCRVGEVFVPAISMSSTSVSCEIEGPLIPGSVEIAVTNNGVDFVGAGMFAFLPKSTVTNLVPSSGPFSAELPVIVEGTGFSVFDTPSCSFGGAVVTAEVLSATRARCLTPFVSRSASLWSEPLSMPVQFSNNGLDFGGEPDDRAALGPMFLFYPEPLVSSLVPSRGVTNGASSIVVMTGINFADHGAITLGGERFACRLGQGGNTAAGVVTGPTRATCEVSCGNYSGRASVEVSLNGGAHWTISDVDFRCDPLPIVESISPSIGPTTGGTTLTVRGSGFIPSASLGCLVGLGEGEATAIPAVWISSAVLECSTPVASRAGAGPTSSAVVVTNDGFHFSQPNSTAEFDYVLPPMVWSVSPSFASASNSDTLVTVTGTNFVNNSISSCHFTYFASESDAGGGNSSIAVAATFLSPTALSCFVPGRALPAGRVVLTVSVNSVDFDEPGAILELEALPQVFKVVPARGMAGATVTPVEVSSW